MENQSEVGKNSQEEIIRHDLVDTAVKFLQNPKVVNSPLAQKQRFLQRRGLTDQEVQLACQKSGAYAQHEQQQQQIPMKSPIIPNMPVMYRPEPYQMQLTFFDRLREIAHTIAVFSVVAYIVRKIYTDYIAPFLFGTKKKKVEDQIDDLQSEVKTQIEEIKGDLSEVKIEIDRLGSNGNTRHLTEIKSEISTVKGLLLARKQFPSVPNAPVVPPSIPAWQMASVPSDHDNDGTDGEGRKEELEEVGSGSDSSEPEHRMKTSESSLEIIYSKDCDSESCHSKKSSKDDKD